MLILHKYFSTANDFAGDIEKVQLSLHRHYNSGGKVLFSVEDMKEFCSIHAPGLFEKIHSSITTTRQQSKQKQEKQLQRTVALIHMISYFRLDFMENIKMFF